jgi:putative flavoprotein involved in K+ transport
MIEKDLLIIGSGPAGLRTAEEAKKAGLDYLILEKGNIAQSWRDIKQDMIMLSPCLPQRDWTSISDSFPIWKMDVTRPNCYAHEFVEYLNHFKEHFDLNLKTNCRVVSIQKKQKYFDVTTEQENFHSKFLVIATGFFGNPFIPDIPGLRKNPIVTHSHQFKSIDTFREKRVIIVGSGNSAAETAINLAGYAQVYLLTRHELQFFSKTKNLCDIRGISESYLLELIAMEIIRHIPYIQIRSVEGDMIHLEDKSIRAQAIICATGYHADLRVLGNMKIETDQRTSFPRIKTHGESSTISNLFFTGPLAYSRLTSLLIHGFIKVIPETIHRIIDRRATITD